MLVSNVVGSEAESDEIQESRRLPVVESCEQETEDD
jgi:hypothetical protein